MWRELAVVAGLIMAPAISWAEPTRNITLSVFDPTPATTGSSFHVQTADTGSDGEYVASAFASYASNPLVLGTVQDDDPVVRHSTMLTVGGAYAFRDRFEAGARLPLYMQSGQPLVPGMFGIEPASGAALGDLTLHGKLRIVRTPAVKLGAALALTVPTASDGEFTGRDWPSARVLALLTLRASRQIHFHVNTGAVIRQRVEFANIAQGSALAVGAGMSFRVLDPLFLHAEAFGDVTPAGYHAEPDPGEVMGTASMLLSIEGLVGARYLATPALTFGLAAGRGITNGFGTPEIRGVFTLAYTPIAKPLPTLRRPERVEVVDLTKEDTDFDRFNDAVDKCPEYPEDKDGFEDNDGCPEADNDKDAVPDKTDKCINVAEDKDNFEDNDGCPEPDNDKDGLPDVTDKCPIKPETINGKDDDDGCPDNGDSLVISAPERLELLETVHFTGTTIAKSSVNVLGQLGATLRARVDIARVRIVVHVQPSKNAGRDLALSEKRAAAVREWLVGWGIAASRIEVKGFGGTKPLVPPNQKGADEINDRVELIIVERNMGERKTP